MNPAVDVIPDIQSSTDHRRLAIQRVGIKSLRYPLRVRMADGSEQATVAVVDADVALPAEKKGTHMSRFVEVLDAIDGALDHAAL